MYDRPKGNFSFLIAFAKQLDEAIATHRDDEVAEYVESIRISLDMLLAGSGDGAGDDDGGDDASIDSADVAGPDTPLGIALARLAELESRGAADVVQPRKRIGGAEPTSTGEPVAVRGGRRKPSILKGKRRGKK